MRNVFKVLVSFCLLLSLCKISKAQKIEYSFGKGSDVVDTIKNGLAMYKKSWVTRDINKMHIYIGADYCDGDLRLSVSQFADADKSMAQLANNTNRFIRINNQLLIPVLFYTDILVSGIGSTRSFMNMNGYTVIIKKNNQGVWKVEKTQITF